MITIDSLPTWRRSGNAARQPARHVAQLLTVLCLVTACTESGVVEPDGSRAALVGATGAHANAVVTPAYTAYDARSDFNGAGIVDDINAFDEFSGDLVYVQPTPWAAHHVTYTSDLNIVLGPGVGLGVQSNSLSAEFGAPVTGQFAAADAFTLFGVDLTLIGAQAPIQLVVSTNLAEYSLSNIDVPLATTGRRFVGLALSQPGEYFTGFRFINPSPGTGLLLDDVSVGHVADRNADPDVSVGGPYSSAEGSPVTFAMSGADADDDALTYSWDLGDGTTGTGPTPPSSHVYADNGTYAIMLAVDDGRGGVDTAKTQVVVANVAPVLSAFSVPSVPLALTSGGVSLPVSVPFTDAGTLDTHTSTLDCGTGATIQSDAPNGKAGGTCTFASAGVYAVQLTVRDDDGGSDTKTASGQLVIYDASAGWVTGGGWIASPEGAYAANAAVTGRLTFGFVAKYQPGAATTPYGNAEFKLSLGKLDFRSTALDWLVVSGGVAQLQGRGMLNGTGDYAFSVTASDGAAGDAIRIRIWQRLTGELVYDNQPGSPIDSGDMTAVAGGSIQVYVR